MKKKQLRIQLLLVSIGFLLIGLTYFIYPDSNKEKLLEDKSLVESLEKSSKDNEYTAFESLEYKGLYDLNKPFTVKSEEAYILNEEPDIVYMTKMHVILNLADGRVVDIVSDKGRYNKQTYDCYFEQNVKATDDSTVIFAENLDLLASNNSAEIYNNVKLFNNSGNLIADKVNYNFDTKYFKISMFTDEEVKVKVTQ